MAKRLLAILAGLLIGLVAERAHACSCMQRGGSLLQWDGDKVPRNFPAFVWYGGEPNDGTWLPPEAAFHLERLQPGKPPQPIAVNLERVDSAFPDLTIPDFLRDESVVRGGLLFIKGQDGQEKVWPRSVLVIARPATPLLAGASYQIVYDREPIMDFGEPVKAQPPQKITFKVANESVPTGDTRALILLGEAKVGPRALAGEDQHHLGVGGRGCSDPILQQKAIDHAPIPAAALLLRRQRRRTPMVPPPQEPSTGAKGSPLLRLARRTFLRAAQPKAGVSTAWQRGERR